MLQKPKNNNIADNIAKLSGAFNAGLILIGIIVLLVSWSGIKVIQTNYKLQKQIATLKQEVEVSKLQNENLKLKNLYYTTDHFLELSARRQFGKAMPGETLVLVPKQTALNHVSLMPTKDQQVGAQTDKPKHIKNLQAWINFFLHKKAI